MGNVEQAIKLIEDILNDHGVPRNVKSSIERTMEHFKNENEEDDVKISTLIGVLDEASNDPNLSLYARTKIWDIVSKLEELNK